MTVESMNAFVIHAKEQGASQNMIRRFSSSVKALYAFLPEDKTLTKERLQTLWIAGVNTWDIPLISKHAKNPTRVKWS